MEYAERSLVKLGEDISAASFKLGEVGGLERAASVVLNMAKDEFGKGKDTRATELRALAQNLDSLAKEARSQHEGYRTVSQAAFTELGRRDAVALEQ
jgi:hypothetical protein